MKWTSLSQGVPAELYLCIMRTKSLVNKNNKKIHSIETGRPRVAGGRLEGRLEGGWRAAGGLLEGGWRVAENVQR